MIKTLDRYIALTFLKNLGIAIGGLTLIYVFQSIMGSLLDGDYTFKQTLIYNLLQLPQVLVQMVPPSVLIATVITLSSFNRSNELTACYSIGVGLKRIMGIFLAIVLTVCCILLFMQDGVLPPIYKKRTTYYWHEMKNRPDFQLDIKQNKIWYRSGSLIYNLKAFDTKSQTIVGMTVYSFDDNFQLSQTIEAEKAKYTQTGWKLLNGTATQFSLSDPFPENKKFTELKLQINETPADFQEIEKEVDGLRMVELYRYIEQTAKAGLDTKAFLVKFHSRISLSFIPLIMCILAVPFSVTGRREGGVAKDLSICLAITFFYWLFYSIGLSLGTNGSLTPWFAAWAPTVIFAALASILVSRKQNG